MKCVGANCCRISSELLAVALSLSKDTEWGVRASVCSQLLMLVKGLSSHGSDLLSRAAVADVVQIVVQLSRDDEGAVRLVAVETTSSLLQYLDKECITLVMVPLLRKMSHALKSEDKTLPLLALHWSRICQAVQGKPFHSVPSRCAASRLFLTRRLTTADHVSVEDKQWFVDFYYEMAALGTSSQQSRLHKPQVGCRRRRCPEFQRNGSDSFKFFGT